MAVKLKMKIVRGKKAKLLGAENLFDLQWTAVGTETMKDPVHNVKKEFTWYTAEVDTNTVKFAECEVAPDQYMFFYE